MSQPALLNMNRHALFFVFTLSGFAGLIYELIWTNYLKLFLGHAAYAQTVVLMIFMGGMALGAWIAAHFSWKINKLFLAYIIVEILIGVMGVLFDPLFRQFLHVSYHLIIPHIHQEVTITLYQWSLSSLIILPQSILLGMTFPLMSNAIIRHFPEHPGAILSMLYFTNSFGAAIGVLFCGFMFIPMLGLPGAMTISAMLNFIVAILTWVFTSTPYHHTSIELSEPQFIEKRNTKNDIYWIFILAAFITGLASFMYEIGWIRLLTLVLGAATHSFELMLSSFILGIALGGLWIKKRIDQLPHPTYFLSIAQLLKGLLALLSLIAYSQSFYVMEFFMHALARTDSGYTMFNLSSYGIVMMVMLPTTFCAGMTLPLITRILLQKGFGEKVIGQVYASNTIGAILGVFVAIHFIMPLLSLKFVIVIGALFDIALGLILYVRSNAKKESLGYALPYITVTVLVIITVFFHLDPFRMTSGVFRTASASGSGNVIFSKDGKTSTVSVTERSTPNNGKVFVIATNGKPDASIGVNTKSGDESMQVLLGALPSAIYPNASSAAVIGFGSGTTSNILLQMPNLKRVDTIEIEHAMVEGAKHFQFVNKEVFASPRSHIVIQDAKVFFANTHRQYDLILSEPSNPWVSGVASLFTNEFYERIRTHLAPHGIFCQWLQTYEINWSLMVSILKALDQNFAHYHIYAASGGDFLIIASNNGHIPPPSKIIFEVPSMQKILEKINVTNLQDLYVRYVIDRAMLHPYLMQYPVAQNSDYFPIIDTNAVRARFLGQQVLNFGLIGYFLPFDILMPQYPKIDATKISMNLEFARTQLSSQAQLYRDAIIDPKKIVDLPNYNMQFIANTLNPQMLSCVTSKNEKNWIASLYTVGTIASLYLADEETKPLWKVIREKACKNTLPSKAQQWLALFQAVSERNVMLMKKRSGDLLNQISTTNNDLPYLVGINMIASLAQNDKSSANNTWKHFRPMIEAIFEKNPTTANQFSLSLKVLVAMSEMT